MLQRVLILVVALFANVTLPSVQAAELDLTQYKGKVVYLDFWASWCIPCRSSFPWMNNMHEQYADKGLVIIAVNLDEERPEADRFLQDNPAKFNIIYDPAGELATRYQVKGMPSSYFYDRSGKLVKTHIGFKNKDADAMKNYIVSLLKQ